MDELWRDIISTSCGGAAAGLALYIVQNLHGAYKDWSDSKTIYKWMEGEDKKKDWEFRSTRTIASYTNLTEDRVRYICSQDKRIFQSTGPQEDRWSIDENRLRRLDKMPS